MSNNFLKYILILPIRLYQYCLSPFMGSGCGCRFVPTCSHYAEEAIRKQGIVHGSYLSMKRILRCHPFGGSGFDPVPENKENRI